MLLPRLERMLLAGDESPRMAVAFGLDRVLGLGPTESLGTAFDSDSPAKALGRILASAGPRQAHLLAWWSTYDAFVQQVDRQESNVGLRVYLGMSHQQLQLISPGEMDSTPVYPTAYWHDYAAGGSPQLFHLYEPFGLGSEPEFLTR